jgi:hypothetical protein
MSLSFSSRTYLCDVCTLLYMLIMVLQPFWHLTTWTLDFSLCQLSSPLQTYAATVVTQESHFLPFCDLNDNDKPVVLTASAGSRRQWRPGDNGCGISCDGTWMPPISGLPDPTHSPPFHLCELIIFYSKLYLSAFQSIF